MNGYRAIAAYYDCENADKEMLRHDVPFFLDHLPARKKRGRRLSVLELAVGTARAAIPIAQAAHTVVGVDYDNELLEIARCKRDAVGLGERDLSLVHGDIRALNLGDRFDWICLFFNTFLAFPSLDEQDAVLDGVRRHLKPAGRFWVDMFQPDMAMLQHQREAELDPTLFHVPALDRTVMRTTDIRRDHARQRQEVTFRYAWFDAGGRRRGAVRKFAMTYLFPRELHLLLERNGLRVDKMYGNYDGSALTAASPRMVALCAAR